MMDRDAAARARARLLMLRAERDRLERLLLRPAEVVRGSLVERHLGTTASKRATACFYVSVPREGGGGKLTYVLKDDIERVRRGVAAYRERRTALRRLRAVHGELVTVFGELLAAQEADAR
jgi:hypothetical protein